MTLRPTPDPRPLTDRELAHLNDYRTAGIALHLDQQRAVAAEVPRLRSARSVQSPHANDPRIDGPY